MNLASAITRFARQQAADGRSAHTRAAYRRDLGALARWFTLSDRREGLGDDADLRRITPHVLARFLVSDEVLLTPSGSPRKPITVNRTKSALRSFFRFCQEPGWVRDNPGRLVRSARTAAREPATLTDEEIGRLRTPLGRLARPVAYRDRLIFELLLGTGIRLGSLVALNVGDADLQAGTLRIKTRGGGEDRVFLNPALVRMVGRLLRESATQGNCGPNPSATLGTCGVPLFRSLSGRRLGAGKSNCGSPPYAARPVLRAPSPFTPSATPSPPACTRRPATCTSSSAPSPTGTLPRRRSVHGWGSRR